MWVHLATTRGRCSESGGNPALVLDYVTSTRLTGIESSGPRPFSELLDAVPRLHDRLLSERLKELETEGVVKRRVYPETPVRIEYELTPMGHDLEKPIAELGRWAERWITVPRPGAEPAWRAPRGRRHARLAHNPDLWIWRDRWEDMGKIFQDGYITGVLDAVEALTWFDSPDGSRLSLAVHLAHSKMASRFPTVRSAVEWVSEEVAKEPDPLTIVAATTITRLLTLDQVTGLQIQFHNGAIWKDRWQRDWWIPGFFADGYPRPGSKRAAKRLPAFLLVPRHAALDGAGGVVSVPRWFDTDLR